MRYSLANDEANRTSFSVEFDNATTYLEIEKIRFGDKLCLENEIEANCLHNELPAMILQPLYENAIKHGVYESTEKVIITTKCICTEQGMEITISNNFDKEAIPRKGAGIGLNNVKRRMKLIYGRTDLVKIYKSETLFEISLFFPLV
jgi:LytS/YehU family sensor histidine kinase